MSVHPDLVPILNKLHGVRNKSNGGFVAFCPAHEDRLHRSLSVDWRDGKLLVKCFAGCTGEEILATLFPQSPQTHPQTERGPSSTKAVSETHKTVNPILDQDGVYVACHVREDGPEGKRYYWTVDGIDHTLSGIRTEDLPLYRIDSLRGLRGQHVWLVEGEKAADALWEIGELVVGTVTGASAIPSERSLTHLAGHFVTLWPDNDGQGRQHMERIAARLAHLGHAPYVVAWDGPPKGDAYDYLQTEKIEEIIMAAQRWEPKGVLHGTTHRLF